MTPKHTTPTFQHICFLQGSEAEEAIDIFNRHGVDELADYLEQYDYGDGEVSATTGSGSADRIYRVNGLVISIHTGIGYVSCHREIGE